jgi:hypothetical protein
MMTPVASHRSIGRRDLYVRGRTPLTFRADAGMRKSNRIAHGVCGGEAVVKFDGKPDLIARAG